MRLGQRLQARRAGEHRPVAHAGGDPDVAVGGGSAEGHTQNRHLDLQRREPFLEARHFLGQLLVRLDEHRHQLGVVQPVAVVFEIVIDPAELDPAERLHHLLRDQAIVLAVIVPGPPAIAPRPQLLDEGKAEFGILDVALLAGVAGVDRAVDRIDHGPPLAGGPAADGIVGSRLDARRADAEDDPVRVRRLVAEGRLAIGVDAELPFSVGVARPAGLLQAQRRDRAVAIAGDMHLGAGRSRDLDVAVKEDAHKPHGGRAEILRAVGARQQVAAEIELQAVRARRVVAQGPRAIGGNPRLPQPRCVPTDRSLAPVQARREIAIGSNLEHDVLADAIDGLVFPPVLSKRQEREDRGIGAAPDLLRVPCPS